MPRHTTSRTFTSDPGMRRFPFVAVLLDAVWALPWKTTPFMWVAFMLSPFWFGFAALAVFIAFILDLFLHSSGGQA